MSDDSTSPSSSMAPVYGGLLALVAIFVIAIGAVAWHAPAGKWIIAAGALIAAMAAAIFWRGRR